MATLTASQLRARVPSGVTPLDLSEFSDEWVDDAIAEHDAQFTRYRGDLPDSATVTETVRPVGVSDRLLLRWPKASAITSITVDGTTLSSSYYYLDGGMVYRTPTGGCWSPSTVVVVEYLHGFGVEATEEDSGAPADLKRACTLYVTKTATADRAGSNREVRASGEFTSYAMPDFAARKPTGWAEVDRIWNTYPDCRMPGIA